MRTQVKAIISGVAFGLILTSALIVVLLIGVSGARKSPVQPIIDLIVSPTSTPAPVTPTFVIPTLTFTATSTATFTPTDTPTSTITPSPTATFTVAEQALLDGRIIVTGPLTREEILRLYETSLLFVAPTFQESKKLGEKINGIGYGSPTLICGPLTLAIMQGAGLISTENLVPYDFWLLDPYIGKDRALINRVFPKDKYQDVLDKTPIHKMDWRSFPLQPGDFLFIRHGTGGNFDHILTVNRVDNQGRAYAVTNYNDGGSFVVNEVMLYDPYAPGAGIFYQWTKNPNAVEGATGFGGFELWRLRP